MTERRSYENTCLRGSIQEAKAQRRVLRAGVGSLNSSLPRRGNSEPELDVVSTGILPLVKYTVHTPRFVPSHVRTRSSQVDVPLADDPAPLAQSQTRLKGRAQSRG